ncbi:hypothetical protein [Acutalibacter muris]|uniref:hypothetical protein n=1 Tax=Acutalibacter muris TaxID=1796620 RepID=UPI0026F37FF1|nr:hypothetical protein [Acutalibacter muris]
MKKFLIAILTAALLISSAGCQAKQPQAEPSTPEPAPQALVVNVESPTENSEKRIDTITALEQITAGLKVKVDTTEKEKSAKQINDKAQDTAPVTSQEKAQETAETLDVQQSEPTTESKAATSTPAPKQPATEPDAYLKVTVKATPTPPPAATPAPTPAPTPESPAPTPAPAEPIPTPAEPTSEPVIEEPSFDIGYWIGYAQSCAQGLGLRLESSAVDCWDNPIGAGPHSTCLERDISSRLNRYANDPDITDVWVWYESTGNNTYNIYIGYA